VKDADKAPIPDELFRPQPSAAWRLGLVVAEAGAQQNLDASASVKAHVEELAASYEKPADVVPGTYPAKPPHAEVGTVVIENNVTDHVRPRQTDP